jgi:hypothetical protein
MLLSFSSHLSTSLSLFDVSTFMLLNVVDLTRISPTQIQVTLKIPPLFLGDVTTSLTSIAWSRSRETYSSSSEEEAKAKLYGQEGDGHRYLVY